MEKFKSFITEAKDEDYRIVVLSVEHGDNAITAKRIKEEADKLKLSYYIIQMDGANVLYNNGTYTIYELDDDPGFEIASYDTAVFVRGTPTKDSSLDLISTKSLLNSSVSLSKFTKRSITLKSFSSGLICEIAEITILPLL